MVDERIKDWIKKNNPQEKSSKEIRNNRLSPDLHKKAAYNAALKGVSFDQCINDAIKKEIASSESEG